MLLEATKTSKDWEKEVMCKLTSFSKKAPVLISIKTGMNEGAAGVFVEHVNSGTKYFFPWNYDELPKEFVHSVKETLYLNHYPRLLEIVYEKKELTLRQMAIQAEKGKTPLKYQLKKVGTRMYAMDKVLLWKNMVVLKLEESTFSTDSIGSSHRYKYDGSLVIYLRKYRTGRFTSIEDASDDFFRHSIYIDQLIGENECTDEGLMTSNGNNAKSELTNETAILANS
jgi:hypothetical protein